MPVSVHVATVSIKINLERFAIIVINVFVRGVKLMNGLSGRRMINYYFSGVNVWRIKLVRL